MAGGGSSPLSSSIWTIGGGRGLGADEYEIYFCESENDTPHLARAFSSPHAPPPSPSHAYPPPPSHLAHLLQDNAPPPVSKVTVCAQHELARPPRLPRNGF